MTWDQLQQKYPELWWETYRDKVTVGISEESDTPSVTFTIKSDFTNIQKDENLVTFLDNYFNTQIKRKEESR